MLFYDEFIKKIERKEVVSTGKYNYSLELPKKMTWFATGIPLLLLGMFQGYTGYMMDMNKVYFGFAIVLILLALRNFKMAFSYKIALDFDKDNLKSDKLDLTFEDVDTATLKRMIAPGTKKLQGCIVIITKDRKEIIIPLIMGNKVEFVALVKHRLKSKFSVLKD